MTAKPKQVSRLKFALHLWVAGMLGMVAVTVTLLRELLEGIVLPIPLWAISIISLGQSAVFVALSVWAGVSLAPRVGLQAPILSAWISRVSIAPVFRTPVINGLMGGLLGGVFLFGAWRYAPGVLADAQERLNLPLFARVLYGGITEELLLRWGLMTVLVWLAWRFVQRRQGAPGTAYVLLAIFLSAMLFGAGHLPTAIQLVGPLNASEVAWVLGVNTTFGLLFGYLFWRSGLESAMIAHALTHVVDYLGNLL